MSDGGPPSRRPERPLRAALKQGHVVKASGALSRGLSRMSPARVSSARADEERSASPGCSQTWPRLLVPAIPALRS